MIQPDELLGVLQKDESPILEFKREWYWIEDAPNEDLGKKWGEFFKDLIGLCNGYLNFVGRDRFLIIGFCESEKKVFNVDTSKIRALQDLKAFKRKIIERLEKIVTRPPLDLKVELIPLEGQNVLVIKIPSPQHLTELKAELATKTRVLDSGTILVRKGQESDSIRVANPQEILDLTTEFDKFKNLSLHLSGVTALRKERSIAKTVQLYIEKNSSFSIDVGFPISHNDRAENIIFEIFRISEELGSSKYFLYIHEHASQGKTHAHIKANNLLKIDDTLIILTERPSIKDIERRKENLSETFKTKHVFFIDEFGLNYLYGDFIQAYESYNLPIFVESLTTEIVDNEKSALKILNNWYSSAAAPLMVIKGYGGIGKSTLAKQFLDVIATDNPGIGLLFIDSNDIIDRLSKAARAGKQINDLYDFYIAQHQNEEVDAKNFSKDLLKLSVDNGSLVIVLDGIDEVIAKLGSKFDITSFVNSILNSYSNNLERGKIIITCRDIFWREFNNNENVRTITLAPFDVALAKDFFSQSFESAASKVERAMAMANKFAIKKVMNDEEESVYIPYVLDMISYLIKHQQEFNDKDVGLGSTKILDPRSISNDFLIGSVCEREIKKLGNYSIDDQINFLIDFSLSPSGHVSLYDIKPLFGKATSLQISDEFVEKLAGHPLLSRTGDTLNFRYDFFYQYFKSLYVSRYFSDADSSKISPSLIDIFGTYVGFDNEFTRSLYCRLAFGEDLLLFAMETIDVIKDKLSAATPTEQPRLRAAISGLFILLLSLRWEKSQSLDQITCTELLKQVFYSNNSLDGICLIGVFGSDRAKPVFDFRNTLIKNSYFEQYEYFWDCSINENTRFTSSSFAGLEPRAGVKPQLFPETFGESCDISDITEVINRQSSQIADVVNELKEKLYQFFKLFYKQGNFYPKKQEDVRARLYTGKLLATLLKNKVIIDYQDPKKASLKQYKVTEEFRPIVKLFEQGGASLEFERVVNMFRK